LTANPPDQVHEVLAAGEWPPGREIDSISLDFDQRHRRRILLTTQAGREVLLDLPQARRLRHGDGLVVPHGIVRIEAAAEPVMDIHAAPQALMRIAWHLGNRHLAVQMLDGALRIRADHVIAGMVAGLGGHVHAETAPFQPEGGAYAAAAGAPAHHHHYDDDHDHPHDHA
jgi:urease accessory protein